MECRIWPNETPDPLREAAILAGHCMIVVIPSHRTQVTGVLDCSTILT